MAQIDSGDRGMGGSGESTITAGIVVRKADGDFEWHKDLTEKTVEHLARKRISQAMLNARNTGGLSTGKDPNVQTRKVY
jgi:hypothetical protein